MPICRHVPKCRRAEHRPAARIFAPIAVTPLVRAASRICEKSARRLLLETEWCCGSRPRNEERNCSSNLRAACAVAGSASFRLLWDSIRAEAKQSALRVDLVDLDYIDPLGKALLAEMHGGGVQIIAHDFFTKAVCDEIVAEAGAPEGRDDALARESAGKSRASPSGNKESIS